MHGIYIFLVVNWWNLFYFVYRANSFHEVSEYFVLEVMKWGRNILALMQCCTCLCLTCFYKHQLIISWETVDLDAKYLIYMLLLLEICFNFEGLEVWFLFLQHQIILCNTTHCLISVSSYLFRKLSVVLFISSFAKAQVFLTINRLPRCI